MPAGDYAVSGLVHTCKTGSTFHRTPGSACSLFFETAATVSHAVKLPFWHHMHLLTTGSVRKEYLALCLASLAAQFSQSFGLFHQQFCMRLNKWPGLLLVAPLYCECFAPVQQGCKVSLGTLW